MLALTREPVEGSDTIVAKLGDTTLKFTIVWVDGYQVRVSVDAPEDVKIVREELIDGAESRPEE